MPEQKPQTWWDKYWKLVWFGIVVFGVAVSYGVAKTQLDSTVAKTDSNAVKIEVHEERIDELESAVKIQGVHLQYIREGIDDIKESLKKGD